MGYSTVLSKNSRLTLIVGRLKTAHRYVLSEFSLFRLSF